MTSVKNVTGSFIKKLSQEKRRQGVQNATLKKDKRR